jgi:glycosyltransferase involved in cell wall biosynthesis
VRYVQAASEATLLGMLARRRRLDVLDSVAMTGPLGGVTHVATVGDVMWMREPQTVSRVTGLTWRALVPRVARRAARVLTYSEASRREIVELLGVPAERIDVVALGPGADVSEGEPEAHLRDRLDLDGARVVLAASGKRETKNLRALVAALPRVLERRPEAVLVLPGEPTPYEDELRALAARLGIERSIRFLGYVPRAELEGLYVAADCFVFPSRHEGFGLPVLEAMRREVPVACSRASSIPEVAGDAALYFDPADEHAIADAVIRLLEDRELAARLVAQGRDRARTFSWSRTAEGTLECFERAVAERGR